MRAALTVLFLPLLAAAADYPKAFLKDPCAREHPCDQQVWLQLDADHPALQATHDPEGAYHAEPAVAPDGTTIVYGVRVPTDQQHLSPLHLVFIDWSGREFRRFEGIPMSELLETCGYGQIEWIDGARLGVKCEINPSRFQVYVILDAISGKVLQEYSGLYFSWAPDRRTLAYVGKLARFAKSASPELLPALER
jgi:hypothetical protein